MVFSKTEHEVEALEREPTLADLGELVEAYCGRCTHEIESAHEGHDRLAKELREELDNWGEVGA